MITRRSRSVQGKETKIEVVTSRFHLLGINEVHSWPEASKVATNRRRACVGGGMQREMSDERARKNVDDMRRAVSCPGRRSCKAVVAVGPTLLDHERTRQ